jgi:hypothetical protein
MAGVYGGFISNFYANAGRRGFLTRLKIAAICILCAKINFFAKRDEILRPVMVLSKANSGVI